MSTDLPMEQDAGDAESSALNARARNPNAYFEIPDFGEIPDDENYHEFRWPVCSFGHWEVWADDVVTMIGVTRQIAQRRFSTMNALHRANMSALDLLMETKENATQLTLDQRDALTYFFIMHQFQRLSGGRSGLLKVTLKEKIAAMAEAGAMIAEWAVGAFDPVRHMQKEQMRTIAARPRGAGKSVPPELVASFFKAHEGEKFENIVSEAVSHFGISASTVKRRLRASKCAF